MCRGTESETGGGIEMNRHGTREGERVTENESVSERARERDNEQEWTRYAVKGESGEGNKKREG